MKISELLAPFAINNLPPITVTGLQNDSRCIQPGDIFLAYAGSKSDGRDFITQAWQKGAAVILVESTDQSARVEITEQGHLIYLPNLREKLGVIASTFFRNPSQRCKVLGVTGTNGKTTLCFVLAQALQLLGHKCAILGTVGQGFLGSLKPTANTTPDALAVQRYLAEVVDQGATHVAMEVSSHGIDQGRVNGVTFDTAILTQIGRDHLDYHHTLEAYVATKARLFNWPNLRHAVINGDDFFADTFLAAISKNILCTRYGMTAASLTVQALDWHPHEKGSASSIIWRGEKTQQAPLQTALWGQFNFYNLLTALSVLLGLNISLDQAMQALGQVKAPPGRLEKIEGSEQAPYVLVDYAHTPDALESVLLAIHQHAKMRWQRGGKLICIFGCGGDRDTGKRPLMGRIATQLADEVILTMDNPRSEDPAAIVQDIQAGCDPQVPCAVILDRAQAIQAAIMQAQKEDVILIAGKGHETTQIIQGQSLASDDRALAKQALLARG